MKSKAAAIGTWRLDITANTPELSGIAPNTPELSGITPNSPELSGITPHTADQPDILSCSTLNPRPYPQAPKKSGETPPVVKSKAAAIGIRRQESRRAEADQAAATAQDMLV